MATTLFPTSGTTTRSSSSETNSPSYKKLSLTRGGGVVSQADATAAGVGSSLSIGQGVVWAATTPGLSSDMRSVAVPAGCLYWISEPLDAVTVAGTITVNIRAAESSTMANYSPGALIFKIASGNGAKTFIGENTGVELGTTEAAQSISITPTSTALAAGDMLAVVLAYDASGTGSTTASGFTVTGFYNGASGATGDTFVTFTETITEQVKTPYRSPFPQLLAQ